MKREWKKLLAFVMALLMVVGVLPGNMAGSTVYAATDFVGGGESYKWRLGRLDLECIWKQYQYRK